MNKSIESKIIRSLLAGRNGVRVWVCGVVAFGREYVYGKSGVESCRPVSEISHDNGSFPPEGCRIMKVALSNKNFGQKKKFGQN